MAFTVHEFLSSPTANGEFLWPADRTTKGLASGATHTTAANTRAVVVTCDSNGRLSMDGTAGVVSDIPLLASIENSYLFSDGGPHTLKFL